MPNEAAFCTGYLGSEVLEEYLFGRKDSQSPWMLIDYFRAADEKMCIRDRLKDVQNIPYIKWNRSHQNLSLIHI